MKVLLIGEGGPLSSTHSCTRIFRELGCEALHWDNKQPSLLFANRQWWRMSRPERAAYDAWVSTRFLAECRRFRPDVIFTQKGENIHSYAIRRALEDTGSKLVIWYGDNPFHPEVSSFDVIRNLRRCDIFYAYGKFLIDALRSAGCRRVEYLPFAFDPVLHPPGTEIAEGERAAYESDVCFVGTWDATRERMLAEVAAIDGVRLAVWGQFWKEKVDARSALGRCVRGGTLWGAEMVKCFKSARLVLNFLRDFNHTSHNFRTMEATGIGGGALLTKRTPEQAELLFREGEHLFCYDDAAELRATIPALLADAGRLRTASANAQRHVQAHHLLRMRIEHILAEVRAL